MERDKFLAVGVILLLAGVFMFLAYYPAFKSLANRLMGYETPSATQSDFEFYNLLVSTVMPIINLFIVIGVTLLLLGAFTREKK